MDITRNIRDVLEAEGIDTVLTRDGDRFIPLWERVEIADKNHSDLFVSIHANASKARRLKGFEVYYLSEEIDDGERARSAAGKRDPKVGANSFFARTDILDNILWDLELTENRRDSVELANCILGEVDTRRQKIKSARFYVLKGALIPAVLVEVGYISNSDECAKLGGGEYRARIAREIVNGIIEYKRRFEASDGFTN